jgi:hypothetical protein
VPCAGSQIVDTLVFNQTTAHWAYMLWAPFAYYRGIWLLGQHAYAVANTPASDELVSALLYLILDIVLYFILIVYFDEVRAAPRVRVSVCVCACARAC